MVRILPPKASLVQNTLAKPTKLSILAFWCRDGWNSRSHGPHTQNCYWWRHRFINSLAQPWRHNRLFELPNPVECEFHPAEPKLSPKNRVGYESENSDTPTRRLEEENVRKLLRKARTNTSETVITVIEEKTNLAREERHFFERWVRGSTTRGAWKLGSEN